MKCNPFNIRLEVELKEKLDRIAEEQKRSLASLIEYLVSIGLDEMELKDRLYDEYKKNEAKQTKKNVG